MRIEYELSDFPKGLIRGKYAKRIKESSNIVVLKPEVAEVFPNEDAVNSDLLSCRSNLAELSYDYQTKTFIRSRKRCNAHSDFSYRRGRHRFINRLSVGFGNYTEERKQIFDNIERI